MSSPEMEINRKELGGRNHGGVGHEGVKLEGVTGRTAARDRVCNPPCAQRPRANLSRLLRRRGSLGGRSPASPSLA